MGCFSFTAEITEERTLTLPPGSPTGRVTVAITPADDEEPSGRRLLAKLHDLQAAIPVREGLSKRTMALEAQPIDSPSEGTEERLEAMAQEILRTSGTRQWD